MPIQANTQATVEPDNWLWPSDIRAWFEPDTEPGKAEEPRPIELDLGCGKGRFLLERSAAHPDIHFLGIERQLRRVRKTDTKLARRVQAGAADNVRLFRIEGNYALRYLLSPACLRTIYIFHPDPWPKKRHAHHRIFGPGFLDALVRVLEPEGVIHFCTDHLPYFHEVVGQLEADTRFTEVPAFYPTEEERTDFELMFRHRRPIGRYSCQRVGPANGGPA